MFLKMGVSCSKEGKVYTYSLCTFSQRDAMRCGWDEQSGGPGSPTVGVVVQVNHVTGNVVRRKSSANQ